jgi:hypothetical protein
VRGPKFELNVAIAPAAPDIRRGGGSAHEVEHVVIVVVVVIVAAREGRRETGAHAGLGVISGGGRPGIVLAIVVDIDAVIGVAVVFVRHTDTQCRPRITSPSVA